MAEARKNTRWFHWLSSSVIILLTLEVVFLVKQNRDLEATLKGLMLASHPDALKPGEHLEPVTVRTLGGHIMQITYTDPLKKYLLFVFSTTCPHCEKTLVSWKKIVSRADHERCAIIGISTHDLETTKAYVLAMDVSFYVTCVLDDSSFSRKYKIGGVPETILINRDATVEKVWIGELSDEQTEEIEKFIKA